MVVPRCYSKATRTTLVMTTMRFIIFISLYHFIRQWQYADKDYVCVYHCDSLPVCQSTRLLGKTQARQNTRWIGLEQGNLKDCFHFPENWNSMLLQTGFRQNVGWKKAILPIDHPKKYSVEMSYNTQRVVKVWKTSVLLSFLPFLVSYQRESRRIVNVYKSHLFQLAWSFLGNPYHNSTAIWTGFSHKWLTSTRKFNGKHFHFEEGRVGRGRTPSEGSYPIYTESC